MWTHVQVTVQKAKGLVCKGKNGTNDAFVTIALGKEKYQTSVKERATDPVSWNEECELAIPKHGNKAEIVLTALHRNFIGDVFLGMVIIKLSDFDGQDKPKNKWYTLINKPGKDNKKERGELEVKVAFSTKAGAGSLSDLREKEGYRSSIGHLASSLGGSFLSLRKEKKGLKGFTKSIGQKVSTLPGRVRGKHKEESFGTIQEQYIQSSHKQTRTDADPGVISDDEDEFKFEELSHKSSKSSLSVSQVALPTSKNESYENLGGGEFIRKTISPSSPLTTNNTVIDKKNRWNTDTNSSDDWEKKLFGRNSPGNTEAPNVHTVNTKVNDEIQTLEHHVIAKNETFKVTKNVDDTFKEPEPVPKPRLIHDKIIKSEQILKSHSMEDVSFLVKSKPEEKVKKKLNLKDALFHSSKPKENEEKHKGTPVGITNPIRQPKDVQQETRLSKETLRKFDGKSRDDLIETITSLQTAVDQQRQKMNEMEDYIDNLLVRVMEVKPTILQSQYSNFRPIK